MVNGQVKLPERSIPDPERRFELADGSDQLSSEDRPPAMAGNAVPEAASRFKQRIPGASGGARAPEFHGCSRSSTRVFPIHASPVTVAGDEGARTAAKGMLFENWPILDLT